MSEGLLQRLEKGFVLGDGGYLMALRMRGFVRTGAMTPQVVATHPEEVRKLTQEFRDAGAEVLQTLTFFGTSNMLKPAGFGERAEEINATACRIAREVAGDDALVAGNLNSPTISLMDYDPSDTAKRDRTRAWLDEQLPWICDGGVDFLILETFSWLDEALLALDVARGTGLPLVVTVSMEGTGNAETYDGFSPAECARRLVDAGADVIGLNCICPPSAMLEFAIRMQQAVDVPICCQPSAWHSWWDRPAATEAQFARFARDAMAADIRYLGSCCGAGPEHVRAMARAMGKQPDSRGA
ncbi:MAG: homocysteine S-methyltransferase family protein [Gemmatimonadota bacterium]|nr:homocysteine S-methyltransferase family protein [Gemmatimonadota bacterium]